MDKHQNKRNEIISSEPTSSTSSIGRQLYPSPPDHLRIPTQCHRIVQSPSRYPTCKIQMMMTEQSEAESDNNSQCFVVGGASTTNILVWPCMIGKL